MESAAHVDEERVCPNNFQSVSLFRVYADFNKISTDGLVAIANAIKENTTLKYIALWGNEWKDAPHE